MNHDHNQSQDRAYDTSIGPRVQGRSLWQKAAISCSIAIVLFYLIAEHRAHFFGALPYLLLLACPLMHFFMHGNHGGHSHDDRKNNQ